MNNIVKEKVRVEHLQLGMYVCQLDRPWLESDFPLQGFYIQQDAEIAKLRNECDHVFIDVRRTIEHELKHLKRDSQPIFSDRDRELIDQRQYTDTKDMAQELPHANSVFTGLEQVTREIVYSVQKGEQIDVKRFSAAMNTMVESVVRNPDAFLWVARLRRSGEYMYQHSIGCSVWAVALGRQLGLTRANLKLLALGAALMDVGKLKLSRDLLDRPGKLNEQEFNEVQQHVELGMQLISENRDIDSKVIEMVATHHERFNGGGYPNNLRGNDIPLFGRIGAIVDCYDAMSSKRPYSNALSPADAIGKLYDNRVTDFHPALVESFIQALGIYPAGSLVELTTGEVGVVTSEYRTRRLRPKVMILLDQNKHLNDDFSELDLAVATHDDQGRPINIKQSLESGAYGIDPAELLLD